MPRQRPPRRRGIRQVLCTSRRNALEKSVLIALAVEHIGHHAELVEPAQGDGDLRLAGAVQTPKISKENLPRAPYEHKVAGAAAGSHPISRSLMNWI